MFKSIYCFLPSNNLFEMSQALKIQKLFTSGNQAILFYIKL